MQDCGKEAENQEEFPSTFNFVTRPGNTFSRSVTGQMCWCRVYGYKPTNETMQLTPDAPWVFLGESAISYNGEQTCESGCAEACWEQFAYFPEVRAVFYGQE